MPRGLYVYLLGSTRPGQDLRERVIGNNYGTLARRDLMRYYDVLAEELVTVPLTDAEWELLYDLIPNPSGERDLLPTQAGDTRTILNLPQIVRRRLERLAPRRGAVDLAAFLARLDALTPVQRYAVVDYLERWHIAEQRAAGALSPDAADADGEPSHDPGSVDRTGGGSGRDGTVADHPARYPLARGDGAAVPGAGAVR